MNARVIIIPVSCWLVLVGLFGLTLAGTEPSPFINYQGTLRDADDKPLEDARDMIFRFYDAASGGSECLVDEHLASGTGDVVMSRGMFNIALGSGNVYDGGGPGVYNDLAQVFRDHAEVYLEVQIYNGAVWETLSPRIRVLSAAYSLNADHLDGRDSAEFLNTSTTAQIKIGSLTVDAAGAGSFGLFGRGDSLGGRFENTSGSGSAYLANGDVGVFGGGASSGGFFADSYDTGYAYVGYGNRGINAQGTEAGGYFKDTDHSGYAYIGYGNAGVSAHGTTAGGYFNDIDSSGYAYVGYGDRGIEAQGSNAGGYFKDSDSSGYAYVGFGAYGIQGYGNLAGGYFKDADHSGYAYIGYGNAGVSGHGTTAGGYFEDDDNTGSAYVGYGDRGIEAYGNSAGGYFEDEDHSGYAYAGYGDEGIFAEGNFAGGTFHDGDTTAYAHVGTSYYGMIGYGGAPTGPSGGVRGEDLTSGTYGVLGWHATSTTGNGMKSFVQNHPYDPGQVIVYASLEGDEVGTYTRGTARLADGGATVALGETFKWVTNPDIGLTAHVTPRGDPIPISVVSVSTEELVVRGPAGSDAVFDFVVYGLRIGFEEVAVVREKAIESFIPSMYSHRARYERSPELRRFNAFERFKHMVSETRGIDAVDLSRAADLKAAIQEYDPEIHGPVESLLGHSPSRENVTDGWTEPDGDAPVSQEHGSLPTGNRQSVVRSSGAAQVAAAAVGSAERKSDFPAPSSWNGAWMPSSRTVEPGDVLALDPDVTGSLHRADQMADATVVGVAMAFENGREGDDGTTTSQALVALTGLVECKVDAGYGAIRAGDLLTSSPTPGYAMRALEPLPGTVLGKALDSLDAGVGSIRVVLMPR